MQCSCTSGIIFSVQCCFTLPDSLHTSLAHYYVVYAENVTIASLNLSTNIKTLRWAPQNDILGHPSVKAFVMQAGINSLYEAAYHAKPVVSIPLVTDQVDNAAKVMTTVL